MKGVDGKRSRGHRWQWLFLLEFVLVLWPPFYNKLDPRLFDIPFFYWYQLACVLIAAVLTAIVYVKTRS